jgi:hypothetical protein
MEGEREEREKDGRREGERETSNREQVGGREKLCVREGGWKRGRGGYKRR